VANGKEPYISAKEPYISAERALHTPTYILTRGLKAGDGKETYKSAKEPSKKEEHIHQKKSPTHTCMYTDTRKQNS